MTRTDIVDFLFLVFKAMFSALHGIQSVLLKSYVKLVVLTVSMNLCPLALIEPIDVFILLAMEVECAGNIEAYITGYMNIYGLNYYVMA